MHESAADMRRISESILYAGNKGGTAGEMKFTLVPSSL